MKPYKLIAIQRLDAEDRSHRKHPPAHVLDEMAETKLSGPRRDRKDPVCNKCFVRKSKNGRCNCG